LLRVFEPELELCPEPLLRWCVELREWWLELAWLALLSLLLDAPKANDDAPTSSAPVRRIER
jgi:hypothetical protein